MKGSLKFTVDGAKLTQIRESAGLSRRQIAEKAGVTHQQIWNYEHGVSEPPLRKLMLILEMCGGASVYDVLESQHLTAV